MPNGNVMNDPLDLFELMDYAPRREALATKEVCYLLGITEGNLRWMRNHPRPDHPPFLKVKGRYIYPTLPLVKWLPHYVKTRPWALQHLMEVLRSPSPSLTRYNAVPLRS